MNYSVLYSSKTGNTAHLGQALGQALTGNQCLYCGTLDPQTMDSDTPTSSAQTENVQAAYIQATDAQLLCVGFWTDKGNCDEPAKAFLNSLRGKNIFLFGTAGFGESKEYYDKILAAVRLHLDSSNTVVGCFMCQGKMPATVRQRYEKMLMGGAEDGKIKNMIENFDNAASHPDQNDLAELIKAATHAMTSIK